MSISVVIPAYNEAENLKILLKILNDSLEKLNLPYEVIVVDTMEAMDNTEELCAINKCTYIRRQNGNNYGDAIRTGIEYASMKYLVIMDADGSHNPENISDFYNLILNCADLVIGSRYIKGGNSHNGIILKLMSLTVNICYRIIFNIKAKDVSNSFRMYKTHMLKSLKLSCNNFDIVEEILILLQIKVKGIKIVEYPIFFNKRQSGKSKRSLVKFMFSYVSTVYKLYRIKVNYPPL